MGLNLNGELFCPAKPGIYEFISSHVASEDNQVSSSNDRFLVIIFNFLY